MNDEINDNLEDLTREQYNQKLLESLVARIQTQDLIRLASQRCRIKDFGYTWVEVVLDEELCKRHTLLTIELRALESMGTSMSNKNVRGIAPKVRKEIMGVA